MAETARQILTAPVSAPPGEPRRLADVPEDRLIELPDGLVGMPHARRFALVEPTQPGSPFHYLVSVDVPGLGFLVCDPCRFWPGYVSEVSAPAGMEGEVAVLAIMTMGADGREMTANLMAPLVIDLRSRRGTQLVLDTGRFAPRHPLPALG